MPVPFATHCPSTPTVSVVIALPLGTDAVSPRLSRLPSWVEEVIVVAADDPADSAEPDDVAIWHEVPVRVVRAPGRGLVAAMRAGCAVATGDLVLLLDAEDDLEPVELLAMVEALLVGGDRRPLPPALTVPPLDAMGRSS